jgi:hypothetical protein
VATARLAAQRLTERLLQLLLQQLTELLPERGCYTFVNAEPEANDFSPVS